MSLSAANSVGVATSARRVDLLGSAQENPNAIPEGETPHAVSMFCYDDLVDAAKPGDRVTVTGIYKAVPMRINPRQRQLKARQFRRHQATSFALPLTLTAICFACSCMVAMVSCPATGIR